MKKYIGYLFMVLLSTSILTSCQPEEFGTGNGLADMDLDASFTITQTDENGNRYRIESNGAENIWYHKWDLGDGTSFRGDLVENIFFPDAGTYTITHTAYGRGGSAISSAQEVVVATSDPVAGNLVKGGKFENAEDHAEWTVLNIGDPGTAWTFNPGTATISGGGWNQQAIYQAIEVEANKEYSIDMIVSGAGAVNTWFEVYASPTAPTPGNDYSADGRRMGLSTWDGCANGPFNGKLSNVGCVGSGNIVSFPQSGTIYLLIKCGGENIGTGGITIDNVEFRGVPQD
ncbi:hypothetical protein J2X31_000862 [Flavobacterium arsenatis]|uniref:PKD domain-containing protein n=1 Tax=Flavobacterium arsenatis TaxID=1484332 RepID=A0ABU1TN52_9FLAO|nr:hypothetical protein [Flavobacterium arsenatis]MDR6966862.1 hypothetical protein [Flavobacterium arsenatis]